MKNLAKQILFLLFTMFTLSLFVLPATLSFFEVLLIGHEVMKLRMRFLCQLIM